MDNQKMGKVVTFANFQGGTGKTTTSAMIAYALAEMDHKVLLIDQDPMADATNFFIKTKVNLSGESFNLDKTLMTAIRNEDLKSIVTEVKKNLYLLPNSFDFSLYPDFLENKFSQKITQVQYFSKLISSSSLKKEFDFIFIDAPPQRSIINDSAFYASNYVVVPLQTQEFSLRGAESVTRRLHSLIDEYGAELDIVGFLPVSFTTGSLVESEILAKAKILFGEERFFNIVVKNMKRLNRFASTGITNEDMHDRRVHEVFKNIAEEFILRLNLASTMEKREADCKVQWVNSPKKGPIPVVNAITEQIEISYRAEFFAYILLNKADTVDDLIEVLLKGYSNTLTESEKRKFYLIIELCREKKQKGIDLLFKLIFE